MENIWSAHTLCLGWLHKCMRLCNPDLWSYFSLLWSISYFVFNHIGQPAGWFPGGLSQMASLTAWPSAQVSLTPPRCFPRVFPASLPMKPSSGSLCQHTSCESWWSSWSARSLFRQCVELACSLGSSSLTVWAFQQAGQSWQPPAPSSRQGCLFPKLAGDDAPGGRSTVNHNRRSSKQDFWWLCSYYLLWWQMAQTCISPGCLFSSWVRRFPEQTIYEKLNTGKWQCCPTGSLPGSWQLKIKFSSLSSVSPAFN